jgi:hypothetical protein
MGGSVDAGCSDCLTLDDLHWGFEGGLVAYRDTSRLGRCRSYTRERDQLRGGLPPLSCSAMVAGCPSPTIEQIDRTVRDPIVQAALRDHTLFGFDTRPVDGHVFRIGVGNDFIDIAEPCRAGAPDCKMPPPAVLDLKSVLEDLDTTELSQEPCKSVFGSP